MHKKFLYLGVAIVFALGSYLCVHLPDTFTPQLLVQDVLSDLPSSDYDSFEEIVSHPFKYLGKGSQAIVFASADGQYVLKFFLTQRFHTKLRIRLPFKTADTPRIRSDVLQRYATAFEKIQEETGLLAIHLSANTTHLPCCTLEDPQGNMHTIDLNQFSFILQKKCDCISKTFRTLSTQKRHEVVTALETLMTSLAAKGFYNLRGSFKDENFAILDKKAIMIDVGNVVFLEEQKKNPEKEIERAHRLLRTWLQQQS